MKASQRTDPGRAGDVVARNIELSREGFRLFEVGDIDGLVALYSRDAVIHHPEGWPEPGPSVGRPAIRRQFTTLSEGWSEHKVVIEEIEGRGDWVVARVRWKGRGGESGVEVELAYSAATRVADGEIAEVHYCWSYDDAVRAAGWAGAQSSENPSSG